jgi:hypothetical protein
MDLSQRRDAGVMCAPARTCVHRMRMDFRYAWDGENLAIGPFSSTRTPSWCCMEIPMNALLRIVLLLLIVLGGIVLTMLVLVLLMIQLRSTQTPSGIVQQRVTDSPAQMTAVVVRDDCGATCGCRVRVDLELDQGTLREIYRDWHACDLDVHWTRNGALIISNRWIRDGAVIRITARHDVTTQYFRVARREQ